MHRIRISGSYVIRSAESRPATIVGLPAAASKPMTAAARMRIAAILRRLSS